MLRVPPAPAPQLSTAEADHHLYGIALLDDEAGAEIAGFRAAHGQVVDRAVHRQAADIATGEKQRRDHERIRGHNQVARRHLEAGLVVGRIQQGVVEGFAEQQVDQVRHGAPAGAVTHFHLAPVQVQFARLPATRLEGSFPGIVHAPRAARCRARCSACCARACSRKRP